MSLQIAVGSSRMCFPELLEKCLLKENRSCGARLHFTQRPVLIVPPGNRLLNGNAPAKIKRLLKKIEHQEISSSERALPPA